MSNNDLYESFSARYDSGKVPWNDPMPPPEVLELVAALPPGHALDLGTGYGRSAIYMAQHNWTVDGVEFVPSAVDEARRRSEAAGVADRVNFYVGDVSKLDFLAGPYDLALDIGCMHSLNMSELVGYRDGLLRLLEPGAQYVLFAHLRDIEASDDEARWIAESDLYTLFAVGFELIEAVLGTTQVADNPPWRSGWFTYRRVQEHE